MDRAVIARAWSVRWSRREWHRLLWAFGVSVAVHVVIYGGYRLAHYWALPSDWLLPHRLRYAHRLAQAIAAKQEWLSRPETPLVFVEVSPRQESAEPPPDTPFYSDRHSRAANREAEEETGRPRLTGTQAEVPRTEDAGATEEYEPLRPAVTPPVAPQPVAPPPQVEAPVVPQPEAPVPQLADRERQGDLAVGRPAPPPDSVGPAQEPATPRPRPRTLAEALARQQGTQTLPGERMKQEGGVKARLEFEALDVRASPFGDYDAAFVRAVAERWYALLEAKRYAGYQRGKVIVRFHLHADGRVTDLQVAETTVGLDLTLLCEMAVLDPAPYAPWPRELRRLVEGDRRRVQFTFYYN